MQTRPDSDNSSAIMAFAVISSVFVVLIIIVLVSVWGIGAIANQPGSTVTLYDINLRGLPAAKNLNSLLPQTLGNFKRGKITGTLQNFNTVYTNGTQSVTLAGSQNVSVQAAIASVGLVANGAGRADKQTLNADPSFSLSTSPNDGPARFTWSHNIWFFDAQATSKSTLDEFMKVFQY